MTVKKDFRFILVMTPKDRENLQRLAELDDVSMSQVIRVLLRRETKMRLNKKRKVAVRRSVSRSVMNRRLK